MVLGILSQQHILLVLRGPQGQDEMTFPTKIFIRQNAN